MAKRRKRKGLLALLGLAALGGLALSGTAKAGEKTGDGYTGPGPNWPPDKRPEGDAADAKPSGASKIRPASVEPWDLWIAPDCGDVLMGERWLQDTCWPAIEAWEEAGLPLRDAEGELSMDPDGSIERVVREIIGPYAPLCVDAWPWLDVQYEKNPAPEQENFSQYEDYLAAFNDWSTRLLDERNAAARSQPKFAALISLVRGLVLDKALGQSPRWGDAAAASREGGLVA